MQLLDQTVRTLRFMLPNCPPKNLYHFILPPVVHKFPFPLYPSQKSILKIIANLMRKVISFEISLIA